MQLRQEEKVHERQDAKANGIGETTRPASKARRRPPTGADGSIQLVMFTGGRDSTLTAARLMQAGATVHLFTASSGTGLHPHPITCRVDELRRKYGRLLANHVIEDISGAHHCLSMRSMEEDILRYQKNLVLLGEKLAIHVHAIRYCREWGIGVTNDGIVAYQSDFPEQRQCVRDWMTRYMAKHGIIHRSPIYDLVTDKQGVKDRLLQLGLSPKSLEGVTMFANAFSTPSPEDVIAYLEEKEAAADEILEFILGDPDLVNA